MRRRRLLPLALALLVLPLLSPLACGGEEPKFADLEHEVKKGLGSEDPAVRGRAFEVLSETRDLRAVELIIKSVRRLESDLEKVRADQTKIEQDYETQFSKKIKADRWFESSTRSSKDMDRYNKAVRKIRKKMDRLRLKARSLENDYTRTKALMDSAVRTLSTVLSNLSTEDLGTGLDTVAAYWRDAREVETRMRWLDALGDLERPGIAKRIRDAVRNAELPVQVRAAALQTLGGRKDPGVYDMALPYLDDPKQAWNMTAAAVQVLRLLHQKGSIPPLIAFLKRDDLGRLRDDTHIALKSLTGEKHGPYFEPWNSWWEENHERFAMPPKPVDPLGKGAPDEGVTFYGIHTFSDRVLFILDISGSMDQAPKPKKGQGPKPPKMAVARKELLGFLLSFDEKARFNVVFFNHEVVPWQQKMVEATETNKRRVKKWIESQEPVGGTNIHDALEQGFGIAMRATGKPVVDTVFFLTDGRPTAGKIQDAERILEAVADWNQTARVTIHCIGVGDHDADFMQKLAKIGGGEYRRR